VQGAKDLVIFNSNAGSGDTGLARYWPQAACEKMVCNFLRQADSWHFANLYRGGKIELELVRQQGAQLRAEEPTGRSDRR